jgi:hypothetical protein
MRLQAGSYAQSVAVVRKMVMERGKGILFTYLTKGALIGASTAVDTPAATGTQQENLHANQLLDRARKNNCVIQLARF